MTPMRVRSGHLEFYCGRTGRWYWRLAVHVHRFHRTKVVMVRGEPKVVANCRCLAICTPRIKAGKLAVA